MNTFTIKDIEGFTGIKAHTIRIWEQRYDFFKAKRKDTNHRIYDNEDLKLLLKVAYLYHHGIKISKIASMSDDEQNQRTIEIARDAHVLFHIHELIEATINYDQARFEKAFQEQMLKSGLEQTITDTIYPFLERIGILWLTNNVIPAQEHFASNIIRGKILAAIDSLQMNYQSKEHFLLFLPEGEFHEIPLLYIQYLLKKSGKMVTSFGSNVPVGDLDDFLQKKQVSHLYTHVLSLTLPCDIKALCTTLQQRYPATRIMISGVHNHELKRSLPPEIIVLNTLDEFRQYL